MRKTHKKVTSEENNNLQFNQIYNNLVHKIKNRIDKAELPAIAKKEQKEERVEKCKERQSVIIGDFVTILKKTLKGGQEEEKKYEK